MLLDSNKSEERRDDAAVEGITMWRILHTLNVAGCCGGGKKLDPYAWRQGRMNSKQNVILW